MKSFIYILLLISGLTLLSSEAPKEKPVKSAEKKIDGDTEEDYGWILTNIINSMSAKTFEDFQKYHLKLKTDDHHQKAYEIYKADVIKEPAFSFRAVGSNHQEVQLYNGESEVAVIHVKKKGGK